MDKKELVNKISYLVSKKNRDQAYSIIRKFEKNNNYEISPYSAIEEFFLKEQIFKRYKLYITRQDFNKDKFDRIIEEYCKQKSNSLLE